MPRLVKIEIRNFRSIQKLDIDFNMNSNLVCFIGRGDSGKTTILEAISAVLSPTWNLTFYDTDFYKCDHNNKIEILATVVGVPDKLLSQEKFGSLVRVYNEKTGSIDDNVMIDDDDDHMHPALSIKLEVDQFLEPSWNVVNTRNQEDKPISGTDRAFLSCYMVSDQVDRHFSWNKGNPLYSLLKYSKGELNADQKNIVIDSLRQAKSKIDEHGFAELADVTELVKIQASILGLDLKGTSTTLDVKELSVRDSRVSLHEDLVPLRLKGKGSKRLASLSIQLALAQNGGIVLVDEIEQGLEPDRIKQLVRALIDTNNGQIFLTTHSRDVITELGARPLNLVLSDKETSRHEVRQLDTPEDTFNGIVRACPEAFFAKKVIVCEGATEVGICRALDKHRRTEEKEQMSFLNCAYVDGEGSSFVERAININGSGLHSAVLCDSDRDDEAVAKALLTENGVTIFDCDAGYCLEKQVFADLPWEGVKELIQYVAFTHKNNELSKVAESIKAKLAGGDNLSPNWLDEDNPNVRLAMFQASVVKKKEWFKRTDHGEILGSVLIKYIDQMEGKCIKKTLDGLSTWIDA